MTPDPHTPGRAATGHVTDDPGAAAVSPSPADLDSAAPSLRTRLDHVALAVADLDEADRRWRDELGGRWVAWSDPAQGFRSRQLRYRGGGKLELIAPVTPGDGGFVDRFLARFGTRIHHVTVKVAHLREAVDTLAAAGMDVVDVDDTDPAWQEAFLRPSQVGGLVVQVAASTDSDEEWARRIGHTPQAPPDDAAVFDGALLSHPDLDRAAALWRLLGADVTGTPQRLVCTWPQDPLSLLVEPGPVAGPVGLRFSGVAPGAATSAVPRSDQAARHQ